jgi:hypothetical protein
MALSLNLRMQGDEQVEGVVEGVQDGRSWWTGVDREEVPRTLMKRCADVCLRCLELLLYK